MIIQKISKANVFAGLAGAFALLAGTASAEITFKDAFSGTKFDRPVFFGSYPGKAQTYVVLEAHQGLALVVSRKDNAWVKDTLASISVNQNNEMGFLGIAFHPDFASNRKFYVSYDPSGNSLFNIVEERVADSSGMKESSTPPRTLIKITDKYSNHNGGTLAFGPKDGYLYFGIGDGGSGGDPDGNGQNTNVLLAKFLRIDVDKKDTGLEYGIPSDNPYAAGGGRGEIYAIGMRNPWKWSFDPLTGDLWAGDVGQDATEEVDLITLGGNYGWKVMEGPSGTNNGKMTLPVYSYPHATGTCIIGGVVFRGDPASKYYGTYFTADYGSKKFWALKKNGTGLATVEALPNTPTNISTFGTDAEGRIYMAGPDNGIIYSLESPDLTPASTGLKVTPKLPDLSGRIFAAMQGGRLADALFNGAESVEIFSTDGQRRDTASRSHPRLSPRIEPGVYLVRPLRGAGRPDLLMVR
ncbi:MAG: PQQ-dependent sugar dehydrogenase [Fibrobacteria bacterium]